MRSVFNCLACLFVLSSVGCVSAGKFKTMKLHAYLSDSLYAQSMRTLKTCQDDNSKLASEKSTLAEQNKDANQQLTAANEVNGQLRKQMAQLSAVSSAQAESIKRSLDNMGARDSYMIALHSAITYRDSVNLSMLLYLKQAIGGYGEQNVVIKLEKGAVYVDLSDSLLFDGDSAGYVVNAKATPVLSRLARALNDQPDIECMIQGRVDSLVQPTDSIRDNWDLALKRAAAIARILQDDQVSPTRITAAARIVSTPTPSADSTQTPSPNRYIRVNILPRLDRLMQLLEHGPGQAPQPPPTPAPAADKSSARR